MIVDAEMTKVKRLYIDWLATARSETEWVKWVKTNSMTSRINVNVEQRTRREKRYIFVVLICRHLLVFIICRHYSLLSICICRHLLALSICRWQFCSRHYDLSILFVDTFLVYINCWLFCRCYMQRQQFKKKLYFVGVIFRHFPSILSDTIFITCWSFLWKTFTRDVFSKSSI